jgi:hypothetical protein
LGNYYRKFLEEKLKNGDSFLDFIFYNKGKISGYALGSDFRKVVETLKQKN